jgi:hypothetical protein
VDLSGELLLQQSNTRSPLLVLFWLDMPAILGRVICQRRNDGAGLFQQKVVSRRAKPSGACIHISGTKAEATKAHQEQSASTAMTCDGTSFPCFKQ